MGDPKQPTFQSGMIPEAPPTLPEEKPQEYDLVLQYIRDYPYIDESQKQKFVQIADKYPVELEEMFRYDQGRNPNYNQYFFHIFGPDLNGNKYSLTETIDKSPEKYKDLTKRIIMGHKSLRDKLIYESRHAQPTINPEQAHNTEPVHETTLEEKVVNVQAENFFPTTGIVLTDLHNWMSTRGLRCDTKIGENWKANIIGNAPPDAKFLAFGTVVGKGNNLEKIIDLGMSPKLMGALSLAGGVISYVASDYLGINASTMAAGISALSAYIGGSTFFSLLTRKNLSPKIKAALTVFGGIIGYGLTEYLASTIAQTGGSVQHYVPFLSAAAGALGGLFLGYELSPRALMRKLAGESRRKTELIIKDDNSIGFQMVARKDLKRIEIIPIGNYTVRKGMVLGAMYPKDADVEVLPQFLTDFKYFIEGIFGGQKLGTLQYISVTGNTDYGFLVLECAENFSAQQIDPGGTFELTDPSASFIFWQDGIELQVGIEKISLVNRLKSLDQRQLLLKAYNPTDKPLLVGY